MVFNRQMNTISCRKVALLCLVGLLCLENQALGRRKGKRGYSGPPPTHPIISWSQTLEESQDPEQRKAAAFKLSKYTQPIYQTKAIQALMACAKDPDFQIKVLCTKALGGAKSATFDEPIRELLISQYGNDPMLKNTVVRVLVARKDNSPVVQKVLQDAVLKTEETDELLALLRYFEESPSTEKDFVEKLADLYPLRSDTRVRRALVKVIGTRGNGQEKVIDLLAQCAQARDTPLALNCLAGLQSQGKKDPRAWGAIQNTIQSNDPDVLLASLDVINALPDTKNAAIASRLLEIISDVEDPDIVEKSILALGVCGEQSEGTVKALEKIFSGEKTEEAIRIAAALTLGKQAVAFPEGTRTLLSGCLKTATTQSLKTACQLGLNELEKGAGKAPASTAQ